MVSIPFFKPKSILSDPCYNRSLGMKYAEGSLPLEEYRKRLYETQRSHNEELRTSQKLWFEIKVSIGLSVVVCYFAYIITWSKLAAVAFGISALSWRLYKVLFGDEG